MGVGHLSPFEVNVRPQVQTETKHIGNTGAQNPATVNNGQTHTPAYYKESNKCYVNNTIIKHNELNFDYICGLL